MIKVNPTLTINELAVALSHVIDSEGNVNNYHGWRVGIIAAQISAIIDPGRQKDVFYAALLHDVGGVELSHHIINYLKRKDKDSINLLLSHPMIGSQMISNIPRLAPVGKLIADHHEWVNAAGYPASKSQKNIPLGSQIIRISDSIDISMRTGCDNFNQLKKRLSQNIGKEFSEDMFDAAVCALKAQGLFNKIKNLKNIPKVFKEVNEKVGLIHIPLRVDAIGTSLEIVAQIIDMKHPYTSGHSLRVSRYALACALAMKFNHDDITFLRWAGLIHDIGKISVSRRILDKPTQLTPAEYKEVKKHATYTAKIMAMIPSLEHISQMASCHHEYFDGSGYPLGLKGDKIPVGARILGLCDAFDAMTSNRPYRNPLTPKAACAEIERYLGAQFDPEIGKKVIPIFKNFCI